MNTRRINKLLDEMESMSNEVQGLPIRVEEKKYLLNFYKDILSDVNKKLRF